MNPRQDVRLVQTRERPDAALLLVCLPFCGGGPGPFHGWADVVADDVAVAVACYPGREGRFVDPFARTWSDLVTDTLETLTSRIDRPYVLHGHSMGGWLAVDLAARTAEIHGGPRAVIVSSSNAPSAGVTAREQDPSADSGDDALVAWMAGHGLLPAHAVADPDLREMAVELLRADIAARDSFEPLRVRIDVPLHVLVGNDDPRIDPDGEQAWAAVAGAGYRHERLPGGHFFTPDIWARLPERMTALHDLPTIAGPA